MDFKTMYRCYKPALALFACLCIYVSHVESWMSPPTMRVPSTRLAMVDSITLEKLSDDHEKVGSELAVSVQKWLDAEWMPQDVHEAIGISCKMSYISCRSKGEEDLMAVMIKVADDLGRDWRTKYDKDAFVNAWDVSNYVSDYLTAKSGIEGCACSSTIY